MHKQVVEGMFFQVHVHSFSHIFTAQAVLLQLLLFQAGFVDCRDRLRVAFGVRDLTASRVIPFTDSTHTDNAKAQTSQPS